MKVKNINGTTDNTCNCGSWLNHWRLYGGGEIPSYCPVSHCIQKPEVGAHAQKDDLNDNNWYIIPLCKSHNNQTSSLIISDSTKLVSANKNKTCG